MSAGGHPPTSPGLGSSDSMGQCVQDQLGRWGAIWREKHLRVTRVGPVFGTVELRTYSPLGEERSVPKPSPHPDKGRLFPSSHWHMLQDSHQCLGRQPGPGRNAKLGSLSLPARTQEAWGRAPGVRLLRAGSAPSPQAVRRQRTSFQAHKHYKQLRARPPCPGWGTSLQNHVAFSPVPSRTWQRGGDWKEGGDFCSWAWENKPPQPPPGPWGPGRSVQGLQGCGVLRGGEGVSASPLRTECLLCSGKQGKH